MAKNFILAFGGTGARVTEAVTYLKAAGYIPDPVHVLLIDPDGANGNVRRARTQVERYLRLHEEFDPSGSHRARAPFSSSLNPGMGAGSIFWEYPNVKKRFQDLLAFGALPREQRGLLELLYDEEDLDRTFEVGYVGRAHIGSLDLYQTIRNALTRVAKTEEDQTEGRQAIDDFFSAIRGEAQAGGTRLIIAGSLFGGTGASGLPIIPALLEELLPKVRSEITVGALLFAPYFSFGKGDQDAPDSALHPLATRAALYHYASTHVGFDAVYLLGAPNRKQTSRENVPGGTNQENSAHYAELGGASAVSHFFSAPSKDVTDGQVLTSGASQVAWGDFPGERGTQLRQRLTSFTVTCLMHSRFLVDLLKSGSHVGYGFAAQISTGADTGLGGREEGLLKFKAFADRYLDWVRELDASSRDTHSEGLLTMPRDPDVEALAKILDGASTMEKPYDRYIRILNRSTTDESGSAVARYLDMLGQSSRKFCAEAYRASWSRNNE